MMIVNKFQQCFGQISLQYAALLCTRHAHDPPFLPGEFYCLLVEFLWRIFCWSLFVRIGLNALLLFR